MALEGNLNSFGLSEILQLIAVQKKTGMLTVSSESDNGVLFFRDGEIVSTRDRRRRARDTFRDYVTRYGVLGQDALARISHIASHSKLDFIDILSSEGFLDEEELEKHWRKQIQESLHDVLTWEQCRYKFISSEEIVAGIRSPASYSIEAMLMESMRRIDEFPQMLAMFPNDRILVTRIDDPESFDEEGMTQNELDILDLLAGAVSLRELISRAGMPLFEVYESLKLLDEKKLVKIRDEQKSAAAATREAKSRRTARRGPRNLLPVVASFVLFAGACVIGLYQPVQRVLSGEAFQVTFFEDDDLVQSRFEYKLRWLIESYRAQHGAYPPSLEALAAAGVAPRRVIDKAQSLGLRYRLTPGRAAYTLL